MCFGGFKTLSPSFCNREMGKKPTFHALYSRPSSSLCGLARVLLKRSWVGATRLGRLSRLGFSRFFKPCCEISFAIRSDWLYVIFLSHCLQQSPKNRKLNMNENSENSGPGQPTIFWKIGCTLSSQIRYWPYNLCNFIYLRKLTNQICLNMKKDQQLMKLIQKTDFWEGQYALPLDA